MQLDPIAVEAGVRLEALATVGSTNKEARIRAQRGERAPLWITAVAQTAGRGRMDRSWVSPAGNLYASLLLSRPVAARARAGTGFRRGFGAARCDRRRGARACAAACLQMAERSVARGPKMRRHSDRRRGGAGQRPERRHRHWRQLREPSAGGGLSGDRSCAATAPNITPQRLFQRLSATMCRRLAQWDRGQGFSGYSRRLARRGARHRRGDHGA